jgi:hypothetical protein
MMVARRSFVAFFCVLAVGAALFLSGAALNNLGLNYSGDDGSSGLKIHPYVMFTVLALLVAAPVSRTRLGASARSKFRTPLLCSAATIVILAIRGVSAGTQSLGFVVDTILSAFWVAAVVPFMSDRSAYRAWKVGFAFVVVECTMAMLEVASKVNFIPIDTWYGSYFRATALHGHPLNNALVLITVATALQLSGPRRASLVIFLLTTAAVSAFGARGALAVYLGLNALMFIRFGLRSPGRMALVAFGVPVAALVVGWMLVSGALGDRISNVGAYDDSSGVRLQSVELVRHLDWKVVFVGADPDVVARLMASAGVGVIENFLVAYVLTFGFVCTVLLFVCVWICFRALWREHGATTRRSLYVIVAAFLLTAATNNSLATKTPALYLCVFYTWVAGREISRRARLAQNAKTI